MEDKQEPAGKPASGGEHGWTPAAIAAAITAVATLIGTLAAIGLLGGKSSSSVQVTPSATVQGRPPAAPRRSAPTGPPVLPIVADVQAKGERQKGFFTPKGLIVTTVLRSRDGAISVTWWDAD